MRVLLFLSKSVLAALLIVGPSTSVGTAAFADHGESKKSDSKDKDDKKDKDNKDKDDNDNKDKDDNDKSDGNQGNTNRNPGGKGKNSDAEHGKNEKGANNQGKDAGAGNGHAIGHLKGGLGHLKGRGNGHVKYDGADADLSETPIAVPLLAFNAPAAVLAATSPAALRARKVSICHRTNSESNPYVTNSPSAQGVIHGHAGHTGPIFTPGLKEQGIKWGDIIPSFDFGPGLQYSGLNWSSDGMSIFGNGCRFADSGAPGSQSASEGGHHDHHGHHDHDGHHGHHDSEHDHANSLQTVALPQTGAPELWIPLVGGLLVTLGFVLRKSVK